MADLPLRCSCGDVRGNVRDVTPYSDMRVVCYCNDCQAFARALGREDAILDTWGGTDILQVIPPRIEITQGYYQYPDPGENLAR